jgi:hypothetical protein
MTTGRPTTKARTRAVLALLAVLAVCTLSGCRAGVEAAGDDASPVTLEAVTGTDRYQVTLTQEAIDRIGIRTATVGAVAAGSAGATKGVLARVPYAAVVYDSDGSTWAYTVVGTDSYVRTALGITAIEGDTAYLTAGPPVGTPVVVVGAPELLGAEYQIAGEE